MLQRFHVDAFLDTKFVYGKLLQSGKNEFDDFRLRLSLVIAATSLQSDSFAPAQFQPTTALALRSAARALLFQDFNLAHPPRRLQSESPPSVTIL